MGAVQGWLRHCYVSTLKASIPFAGYLILPRLLLLRLAY